MEWKLGYGSLGLIALILSAGLICYAAANRPVEVPVQVTLSERPVLSPYPELEGLLVHVNSASVDELQQLPGIGETRAKAIRAYIKAHGALENPKQLLEVEGIGEVTLEGIRPYLSFS